MFAWTKALSMTRLRLEAEHSKAPTPPRHCRRGPKERTDRTLAR